MAREKRKRKGRKKLKREESEGTAGEHELVVLSREVHVSSDSLRGAKT